MSREKRVRLSEKEMEILKETKDELSKEYPFLKSMAFGSFINWMCFRVVAKEEDKDFNKNEEV